MKISEAIRNAIKKGKNENSEIRNTDAKRILRHVLGMSAEELIFHSHDEVSDEQETEFFKYIDELIKGRPLQYITNSQSFWGHDFFVNDSVLIPQPDTELLVEKVIEYARKATHPIRILDLCTGSGAIAISLKAELGKSAEVVASDISKDAINVAKINAKNILGHETEVQFIESDMFENIEGKFDIIVSNPPYIETDVIKTLDKDVQNEPKIALDGGIDGLKFYRIIQQNVDKYLKPHGKLLMEIGYNQKDSLLQLFPNAKCLKDYANNDRLLISEKL